MKKKANWGMRSAHIKIMPVYITSKKRTDTMPAYYSKLQSCDICYCRLDCVFSGIHVITNGATNKTVCGLCAAYSITDGWKEVLRAKSIGRD